MQIKTTINGTANTLNMSAKLLYEEAIRRNIHCTLFSDSQTILMEKNGKQWYTIGSRTSLQSSVGRTLADKKNLTKQVFEHFQIPTARFILVKNEIGLKQLSELSFPVVMKPTGGSHGDNVIVGIPTKESAEQAFFSYRKPVLFEEQLQGTEFRIVCVNYKFCAASYRKPAFITGDGLHTIAELIAQKNAHPLRSVGHLSPLTKIKINEQVQQYLAEQTYSLESVPEKNTEIFLRKTANLSTGGEAFDVTQTVCEENKILFEKIAEVCDLNTIGIDIMCQSLTEPIMNQQHAGVIEVNASPGLRMHQYPVQGKAINIAKNILDMVENHYFA